MAYNRAFNPDALPAHAEPEQAAQALGTSQGPPKPAAQQQRPSGPSSSPQLGAGRGAPPPRQGYRPPQQYSQNQQYDGRPPPRDSYDNRPPPRDHYDNRPPPRDHYDNRPPPRDQYGGQQQGYSQQGYGASYSPPPNTYGNGPRPYMDNRPLAPPTNNYPSRTPAPPDPDSADLYPLFRTANGSGTGSLTESELGNALVNADFTPFDELTIRSLMKMFSTSPPQQPGGPTVTFPEFQSMWRFLAAWRELFEKFDEDHSGRISLSEFSNALIAFGYTLSQTFVSTIYNTFNDRANRRDERRGSRGMIQGQGMTFDLFVQACISLRRMTDVFKQYDDDRDGYVTLSFEEFLTEILKLRE